MNEFLKIKKALDDLSPVTSGEWDELLSELKIKHFRKSGFLIRAGQVENHIYFLNKGATRNYFIKDGKDFTVDFLFEGSFVTAYYSFITREPSSVYIELLDDTETVVISYEQLQRFYKKYHYGEKIGRLIAESQYVKRLRREMELLSLTAEERYVTLLKKDPVLVSNLSVKHLSSYLGIQPESLSRIRRQYAGN